MKSALVKKRNNFNIDDKTANNQDKTTTNLNFNDLNRRLSVLDLNDNNDNINNRESPSDLDNEQKEPEDRGRKNSLFDSENYINQPSKNGFSPSAFDDEFKGGRDEETNNQSEEESDLGSSSGNYPTYKGVNSIQEDNISSSKQFSLDMAKNQIFEYPKNVNSPKSESSLPNHRSQNKPNTDSSSKKYIDSNVERIRKASIVSATPCNSETEQSFSEVEAEMRKKSIDMGRQALLKSKLSTISEKKIEKPKNIFDDQVKEYNLKIVKTPGNLTYSIDHPDGTEFKDIHVVSKKDSGIDISVSISGGEADLSQ